MTRISTWALLAATLLFCSCHEVSAPEVQDSNESKQPSGDGMQLAAAPIAKPPPPEPIDRVGVIPVEKPAGEEPVIKDVERADRHDETDNDEEIEESKGEEDALNDKPFDGMKSNDAIGLGAGGGGASGGRRNHVNRVAAGGGAGVSVGARPNPARRNLRKPPSPPWADAGGGATSPWTDTESYASLGHNPFLSATRNPLSTFSIDVDTASLANVRRFLREGCLPPPEAVRIEELLNWYDYSYPEPDAGEPFSRTVEVAACPWSPGHELVRIGLKGRRPPKSERKPSNLVFLLDVSGSMDSPDKLPLLRQCMTMMVDHLTENDRVAIVTYASWAGIDLRSTPGSSKEVIKEALGKLRASGSTNGAGGIRLAYETAQSHFIADGINRVILATDGDFNVGIRSNRELVALIKAKARTGVFLSCLGFGTGNLKDDRLEALADNGNGHYAYIDSMKEGWKVLNRQLHANLETIAKDVKIQVEFNPARVRSWRLIGYENRILAARDFNDDKKDAGDIGAGHTVTALYEIDPVSNTSAGPGVDKLRYQGRPKVVDSDLGEEILTLKLRFKEPDGEKSRKLVTYLAASSKPFSAASADFRFAAAVSLFGMVLRQSPYRGEAGLDLSMEIASGAIGSNSSSQRVEFVDLVRNAQRIVGNH